MKIIHDTKWILPYRDDNLGKFSLCNKLLGFIECCGSTEALGYDESFAYSEHSVREEVLAWSFERRKSLINAYQFLVILCVFLGFYNSIALAVQMLSTFS